MIYLDYAATSWPKPKQVLHAMANFLEKAGGNPSRSGHSLSIAAGRIVYETRESLARLFNVYDPLNIIFTNNSTHSLNIVIQGLLKPGDKVVTTSIEHNAVMRPLRHLEKKGIHLTIVPCRIDSSLDIEKFKQSLEPDTRMVIINHASNVTGTVLPIEQIGKLVRTTQAFFVVDAAQSAGHIPIDMQAMDIDFLAFSGHKALLGPPGTGGLVISKQFDIEQLCPLIFGGTGSKSESEEQPNSMPDRFESGTINGVGIAGLGAGVEIILKKGIQNIHEEESEIVKNLIDGLANIPNVKIYGHTDNQLQSGVVSFTAKGAKVSEIGYRLDEEFKILCRVGLQCAPAAHRTIGTFPEGTIRFSVGPNTNKKEIKKTLSALQRILKK